MRKKSYTEIARQARRILGNLPDNPTAKNVARANKVFKASGRYLMNILKSKAGQKAYSAMVRAANEKERNRIDKAFTNRKFSQRIYMGLSNG